MHQQNFVNGTDGITLAAPFDPTIAYTAGAQAIYAGILYTFTADHLGQWTGADVTFVRQLSGRANTIGQYKFWGNQAAYTPNGVQTTVVTVPATTRGGKMEAEAPFSRVKIMVHQREPYPSSGFGFLVASTEVSAIDTIANAVNPIVGGTQYNAFASGTQLYGWNKITWGNAPRARNLAPAGAQAAGRGYLTSFDTAVSDWAPCPSVPPLTGSRPFFIMRANRTAKIGESINLGPGTAMQTEYNKYAAGDPTARLYYNPTCGTNDQVGDPTLTQAGATLYDPTSASGYWPNTTICLDHGIPCRNFGGFGDSITEGYSWWQNAVRLLSTPQSPAGVVNWGFSSNQSNQYVQALRLALRDENYITDLILPSFSPNESLTQNVFTIAAFKAQIEEVAQICREYGIRLFVWTSYAGLTSSFPGTNGAAVLALNVWVRRQATLGNFNLIEIESGWDNATMNGDAVHPNALGIAYMQGRCLSAIQTGI